MKGTEKIIAHIRSDAEAQAAAILSQAEQKCAEIRAEYDKQATAAYTEKIRAGVKECSDQVDSMGRIAQMEAKKGVLALKQSMVSKSFDLAQQKLVSMDRDEYVAFLAKLAADASVTHDEQIVFNAEDKKSVGRLVAATANGKLGGARLSVAEDTGDFAGGILLRRGNIEVNCTVELLVDLCRNEMSAELAEILFA